MLEDTELVVRDTKREDLARISEMEQGEAREFIIPYSLERHQAEFARPEVVYKSIRLRDELVGFLILVLDPDGRSVEFRRVVVSRPGHGYGKRVVRRVDELCRSELGRRRIWLDVFETNERARHVYEQCGYRWFGESEHEGRTLLLYEKEAFMKIQNAPVATSAMLIRKPVSEVFEAFMNPAITSKFWFTKGSDRLQTGKQIRWDWEMYDHSVQVSVKEIEANKRILIEWGAYGTTTVEWVFTPRADHTTFVSVTNSGFSGDGDEVVEQALDSTGGFALVLAGAKAFLEHNIKLNLIADRFPAGH